MSSGPFCTSQVDNSRNQAEHLLMLLSNEYGPADDSLLFAATRLHTRLFANYRKWCDRMGTPPLFSKRSTGNKVRDGPRKTTHRLLEFARLLTSPCSLSWSLSRGRGRRRTRCIWKTCSCTCW